MANTPNRGIPYVPEGTLDPAAGLNQALNTIDALLQCAVISMSLTEPPASPSDGDLYIVSSPATGNWEGHEDQLARYVEEGDTWQFWGAGTQVFMVYDLETSSFYVFASGSPGSWTVLSGGGGGGAEGHAPINTLNSSAGGVAIDLSLGAIFTLTLTENISAVTVPNGTSSQANWFTLRVKQDGTGGRTWTNPASWKFPSGAGAYSPSSAANKVDLLEGISYDNGTTWLITYAKDIS